MWTCRPRYFPQSIGWDKIVNASTANSVANSSQNFSLLRNWCFLSSEHKRGGQSLWGTGLEQTSKNERERHAKELANLGICIRHKYRPRAIRSPQPCGLASRRAQPPSICDMILIFGNHPLHLHMLSRARLIIDKLISAFTSMRTLSWSMAGRLSAIILLLKVCSRKLSGLLFVPGSTGERSHAIIFSIFRLHVYKGVSVHL